MLRVVRRVLLFVMAICAVNACADAPTDPAADAPARLSVLVVGAPQIKTIVVTVSGSGILSDMVFNFPLDSLNTARGLVTVPAGSVRRIVTVAIDSGGTVTHRADTTVKLVPGDNPSIAFQLKPLSGSTTIVITMGGQLLALTRPDSTLAAGSTLSFTAQGTGVDGAPLPANALRWASSNPAVLRVDSTGTVVGLRAGTAVLYVSAGLSMVTRSIRVMSVAAMAAQFDGTGRVTIPHTASLAITGPFTIETWVYVDAANTSDFNDFLSKLGGGLAFDTWSLRVNNGSNLTAGVVLTGGTATATRGMLDPAFSSNVLKNQWQHVAITWDGQNYRQWLNGRVVGERTFSATLTSNFGTNPITMGAQNGSFRTFRGKLDEVRVSNVARYSAAFTPALSFAPDSNTRGLWSFDGGDGVTVIDRSGNGNNGSIAGGVTIVSDVPLSVPSVGPATQALKWSGDNAVGPASQLSPLLPTVQVKDANGIPVSGASVTFAVASGGGTVVGGSAITDAGGFARPTSWTFGAAGAQSLTASVGALPVLTFTATAQ